MPVCALKTVVATNIAFKRSPRSSACLTSSYGTRKDNVRNSNSTSGSLVAFFTLTFLLSVPFYILNALAYLNFVGKPEMGALYIALFTVTPIGSPSILTF